MARAKSECEFETHSRPCACLEAKCGCLLIAAAETRRVECLRQRRRPGRRSYKQHDIPDWWTLKSFPRRRVASRCWRRACGSRGQGGTAAAPAVAAAKRMQPTCNDRQRTSTPSPCRRGGFSLLTPGMRLKGSGLYGGGAGDEGNADSDPELVSLMRDIAAGAGIPMAAANDAELAGESACVQHGYLGAGFANIPAGLKQAALAMKPSPAAVSVRMRGGAGLACGAVSGLGASHVGVPQQVDNMCFDQCCRQGGAGLAGRAVPGSEAALTAIISRPIMNACSGHCCRRGGAGMAGGAVPGPEAAPGGRAAGRGPAQGGHRGAAPAAD